MEAKLVIVSGASKASEFKLKLPTVIGRSRSVDLPLGHSLVSRQHCELFEDNGVLKLRDLGSLNGTFMDGTRITAEIALEPGDQFTVGPVTFQAVYGVMPAVAHDPTMSDDFSGTLALPPRASSVVNGRAPAKQPQATAQTDAVNTAADQTEDVAAAGSEAAESPAATEPDGAAVDHPEGFAANIAGAGELASSELASSELGTEELEELELSEAPENLQEPPSAGFDADQFNWLQDDAAGPAAAGAAEETIDFGITDDAAASGETAPRGKSGGKPDKKASARGAAKKPEPPKKSDAKKADGKKVDAKKGDAKQPDKASDAAAKPGSAASPADPSGAEEPDFMPPAPSHAEPGLDDVFDFLQ